MGAVHGSAVSVHLASCSWPRIAGAPRVSKSVVVWKASRRTTTRKRQRNSESVRMMIMYGHGGSFRADFSRSHTKSLSNHRTVAAGCQPYPATRAQNLLFVRSLEASLQLGKQELYEIPLGHTLWIFMAIECYTF